MGSIENKGCKKRGEEPRRQEQRGRFPLEERLRRDDDVSTFFGPYQSDKIPLGRQALCFGKVCLKLILCWINTAGLPLNFPQKKSEGADIISEKGESIAVEQIQR